MQQNKRDRAAFRDSARAYCRRAPVFGNTSKNDPVFVLEIQVKKSRHIFFLSNLLPMRAKFIFHIPEFITHTFAHVTPIPTPTPI